ncbi:lipopolysaccharide biosynthesis protein [Arthrobacter sp. CDRTa11]|uniref:lipopolysaccharide biosynthesis protein n=1 Tax=Arthrobacter sp. CDRTa11 TaxID=2651199 RepID=UPI002265BF21|nr:lipopolysaccharide biosynthesis protein [Arthrobacter sp. CDRTa11]UZX04338.1 lipopolysaccharide biosynthesis protein [Arthrobacter sp. CDRTa11]
MSKTDGVSNTPETGKSGETAHVIPLSHRAARGAGTMALSQVIRIGLQLFGIIILARLLMPSDYGLIAMATAIVGVAEVLRDFGLAPAAIQAKSLSAAERSNLVWANSGLGLLLGGLVTGAAWPIGALYGDSRLVPVVLALAPIFFINGISSQFRADLSRGMHFSSLAKIEIVAQVLAITVGVGTALMGLGYWAIVCQQVVQALSVLIMVIYSAPWRLRKYDRTVSLRPFLKYGSSLLGTQLLVYATSNLDSVLIGARFGSAQLGLYNRAFQMLVLPLNQISSPATRVALPVLSRIQSDESEFHRFVLRGQLCLTWLVLPAFGFVAVNSHSVVVLLLGEHWAAASTIFSLLAVGGMFQTLSYTTYWIFLAKGLTASNLRFALITRTIMLAALVWGALFSVHAVAAAYSLSLLLIWLFGLIWIARAGEFKSVKAFTQGLGTLVLVAVSSAAAYFTSHYFGDLISPYRLLVSGGAFITAFCVLCMAVPFWRRQAFDIIKILRLIRRRSTSKKSPRT